ncbi:hypothetical protein CLAFUW4_02245 [Fulvia fulva]|uniref:Uncharacterized protein n=1 Tax=Passalora fulva TaxID=5499 RepID=A0A9Q8P2R1_PASFU|nr:uncharacterized protein CLAFUR5_02235 [Fulvia fulva]KAK4634243.1 hypothetical protein CLAFUR4_02240 [Fulvia fulva]KAK4636655.1 hypothetical protein CLAFUR0_02243 [Fulvia fulva]UJO11205.1 hypothetical protein CLAFUR5_02235 [Fulvia fulva]WPV08254.1 hypothetical protein CLAFUW4_02245 [Fulvia fulva]WPV24359.1 hypothetical protein CLAFUW7_02245 [Fulvia fulva]
MRCKNLLSRLPTPKIKWYSFPARKVNVSQEEQTPKPKMADLTTTFAVYMALLKMRLKDAARRRREEDYLVEVGTEVPQFQYQGTQTEAGVQAEGHTSGSASEAAVLEANEDSPPGANGDIQDDGETSTEESSYAYVELDEITGEDFTAGPARFIPASDGLKECIGLAVTADLLSKILDAAEAQRSFARESSLAVRKQGALMNLQADVDMEISGHELRIMQAKEEPGEDDTPTASLEKELENLRLFREHVDDRRRSAEELLRSQANNLIELHSMVGAILEEACEAAKVLEPMEEDPIAEVEALDLQTEYRDFVRQRQNPSWEEGDEDNETVAELQATRDEDLAPEPQELTEEEQAYQDGKDHYFEARERLEHANERFDRREMDRELERGETEESDSDFDLRWVQRNRELTTEVIEAEVAYAEAKVAAFRVGVELRLDDQSSGFGDEDDNGYRESYEAACKASVDQSKITSWLQTTSDDIGLEDDVGSPVEADDWEAAEVAIGDSGSCIMQGSRRRRIDQWKEQQQVCRTEVAGS